MEHALTQFIGELAPDEQKCVLASISEIARAGLRCENEDWCEELFSSGFYQVKCGQLSLIAFSPTQDLVVLTHAFSGVFSPDEVEAAKSIRVQYLRSVRQ